MYTSGTSVGYLFTDVSGAGNTSYWYLNGVVSGPGNPVTGGPGTSPPITWLGPGMHRICLVSEIATAVGIVCRDTVCRIITVPQQPIIALCDTEATII
ncbi:MAG: hypothetical protein R3B47_00190 [Bacteroidia bacterium]